MTPDQSKILSLLKKDKWVINDIFLEYRKALLLKLPDENKDIPTYFLTSKLYKLNAFLDYDSNDIDSYTKNRILLQSNDLVANIFSDKSKVDDADETYEKLVQVLDYMSKHDSLTSSIESFVVLSNLSFRSASHPHLWGLIAINKDLLSLSNDECSLSIIHEVGHQELLLVNLLDRLVNQKFDYSMVHAPYQSKERPPIGRLHSAHALYRMILSPYIKNDKKKKFCFLLTQTCRSFKSGELTEFGNKLIEVYLKLVKETHI